MQDLYSTDLKYLIPIIGIFIGWLLASVTGLLKSVTEKKQILGKVLPQLHYIYLEQAKVLNYFDIIKDTYGINQHYERLRRKAMDRYVLNNENLRTSLATISDVATIYPVTAMRLKHLIESYSFSQKMDFTKSVAIDTELYLKLLSIFETTFEIDHKEFKKIILKISFGHGLITWLQMKRKYKRMEANMRRLGESDMFGLKNDLKMILSEIEGSKEK